MGRTTKRLNRPDMNFEHFAKPEARRLQSRFHDNLARRRLDRPKYSSFLIWLYETTHPFDAAADRGSSALGSGPPSSFTIPSQTFRTHKSTSSPGSVYMGRRRRPTSANAAHGTTSRIRLNFARAFQVRGTGGWGFRERVRRFFVTLGRCRSGSEQQSLFPNSPGVL